MDTHNAEAEIRRLNDQLRSRGNGGRITITRGIAALGADMIVKIMLAVVSFNAFTPDNDPYKEHDCAILEVDGVRVLWKIDRSEEQTPELQSLMRISNAVSCLKK